ncbi:proteasome complex subunit Rpn13 ubiquitin receptor-domain-containing protein [Gymnopilus junonius]|uniref:Proteasome complex subunit Rpn13 ubiquitin receptor-domain-containing protein n=1 Tax=Gymnopilus junonius TaxID=109634 RepID=A0A9P5NWK2_GYMJU|nr:proteasome complex subunit Rpn13 ubiquitin receptor-domain-containing protein [Gymnopilus junonius]
MSLSIPNSEILLAFKAGRAFRREGSSAVEPSRTKGAIYLTNGDDGLLHFIWVNRETNTIEEDLILFPFDASFLKVSESPGRVYVLKFSSSNQRHFFWLQDASSARDEEFTENVNGLLRDPEFDLRWNVPIASTAPEASAARPSGTSTFQATPDQLATLSQMLSSITGAASGSFCLIYSGVASHTPALEPDVSLIDILTPANLTPLFNNHPELIPALFPQLPPDLPVPPSAEALQRIIHSPQFRAAVSNFDQALRTGLLGGLVRTLGLPEEAGTGVGPFLRAIQEQADRERNNNMDTD